MGAVRTVIGPSAAPSGRPQPGSRLTRGRPRAFSEWQALRRWGKLPDRELQVAGYLLRQAREDAGLTQRELASRLGSSQQAINQAERWQANPTAGLMHRWAEACGVELRLELRRRRDEHL